jgi:hypothetical protein
MAGLVPAIHVFRVIASKVSTDAASQAVTPEAITSPRGGEVDL